MKRVDRRNLISVAVYAGATSASQKPTQRASYRRHQIYISSGEEPTGAWLAIAKRDE